MRKPTAQASEHGECDTAKLLARAKHGLSQMASLIGFNSCFDIGLVPPIKVTQHTGEVLVSMICAAWVQPWTCRATSMPHNTTSAR
jgi:hypothetical protein